MRASYTSEPVTSPGIRSGVNCTRGVSSDSAAERARTRRVFATPGTPSSRTCPRASSAMTSPVTAASWPTTALATSLRTASSAARAARRPRGAGRRCGRSCGGLGSGRGRMRGTARRVGSRSAYLSVQLVEDLGQAHEPGVVGAAAGRQEHGGHVRRPGSRCAGRPRRATVAPAGPSAAARCARAAGSASASRRVAAARAWARDAAVHPGPALGGLDGADDDRQRLRHQPAQPPAPPEHADQRRPANSCRATQPTHRGSSEVSECCCPATTSPPGDEPDQRARACPACRPAGRRRPAGPAARWSAGPAARSRRCGAGAGARRTTGGRRPGSSRPRPARGVDRRKVGRRRRPRPARAATGPRSPGSTTRRARGRRRRRTPGASRSQLALDGRDQHQRAAARGHVCCRAVDVLRSVSRSVRLTRTVAAGVAVRSPRARAAPDADDLRRRTPWSASTWASAREPCGPDAVRVERHVVAAAAGHHGQQRRRPGAGRRSPAASRPSGAARHAPPTAAGAPACPDGRRRRGGRWLSDGHRARRHRRAARAGQQPPGRAASTARSSRRSCSASARPRPGAEP